jgi:hypothetical protein
MGNPPLLAVVVALLHCSNHASKDLLKLVKHLPLDLITDYKPRQLPMLLFYEDSYSILDLPKHRVLP